MAILVCGGAGYIGSHAVAELLSRNEDVVIIDNLQTGHEEAALKGASFYNGDLRDEAFLRKVFQENDIEAVMHFAADSLVGESVTDPLKYYDNNVYGAVCLLKVMKEFDVKQIVSHQPLQHTENRIGCRLWKQIRRIRQTRTGKRSLPLKKC